MKRIRNLTRLLNLNYLRYSNKSISCGIKDLPAIDCNIRTPPDYIALYREKGLYCKTANTAVAFYEYDDDFDGKNGLFWAIYYQVEDRLDYYRERFKNVRYVIIPDYSELGDIHRIENDYRLFKGRIVGLWFMFEIGAIVIPNITIASIDSAAYALDGYENCSTAAISTKGHMDDPVENHRLRENIRMAVDTLSNLQMLIVYDVCSTNDATLDTFSYAIERGIKVIIPNNTLKLRNEAIYCGRHSIDTSRMEVH